MTWFASHLYAQNTPQLLNILKSDQLLSGGLYLLKEIEPHTFPTEGILVVREICNPDSEEARFHRDHIRYTKQQLSLISWNEIVGPPDLPIIRPKLLPVRTFDTVRTDIKQEDFPPVSFLRYIKRLSSHCGTNLVFYHHFSAAETAVGQEFCCVFGAKESVFVNDAPRKSDCTEYIFDENGAVVEQILEKKQNHDPLSLALRHVGVKMTPPLHFEPHTRLFPWDKYKI